MPIRSPGRLLFTGACNVKQVSSLSFCSGFVYSSYSADTYI
jgi:hypothetical protein